MGKFKITMALSMMMAAFSTAVNLSAFLSVYHVAKEIVQSRGDFSTLNQAYLIELGRKAVFRISMAFGTYGMALLFSCITAFITVARTRISLIEVSVKFPHTLPESRGNEKMQ